MRIYIFSKEGALFGNYTSSAVPSVGDEVHVDGTTRVVAKIQWVFGRDQDTFLNLTVRGSTLKKKNQGKRK